MKNHGGALLRNQPAYLTLLVLISVVNAASQILMRWGGVQAARCTAPALTVWEWLWVSRWWLSGIMVGWIAGLGWAWCLRRLPLGLAIPLYAGLAYVLSLVSAVYILKEKMSAGQIVGIAVILTGVLLVTLSSTSASGAYSR
jgi:multidrug transporter EmrE-like cation transporter